MMMKAMMMRMMVMNVICVSSILFIPCQPCLMMMTLIQRLNKEERWVDFFFISSLLHAVDDEGVDEILALDEESGAGATTEELPAAASPVELEGTTDVELETMLGMFWSDDDAGPEEEEGEAWTADEEAWLGIRMAFNDLSIFSSRRREETELINDRWWVYWIQTYPQ